MLESLTNKVAGLRACNFNKNRLQHVKHVKFAKLLRATFLQNSSYFEENLRTTAYRVFNVINWSLINIQSKIDKKKENITYQQLLSRHKTILANNQSNIQLKSSKKPFELYSICDLLNFIRTYFGYRFQRKKKLLFLKKRADKNCFSFSKTSLTMKSISHINSRLVNIITGA